MYSLMETKMKNNQSQNPLYRLLGWIRRKTRRHSRGKYWHAGNTPSECPECGYLLMKVLRGLGGEVTRVVCPECDWRREYEPWTKKEI